MKDTPYLDTDHFCSYVSQDREEQRSMALLFFDQCAMYMAQIKAAYISQNHDDWHTSVHALKGLSSFSGAFRLYKDCCYAQDLPAASQQEKERMVTLIEDDIKQACDTLRRYLDLPE